jgi:hypothetical protein
MIVYAFTKQPLSAARIYPIVTSIGHRLLFHHNGLRSSCKRTPAKTASTRIRSGCLAVLRWFFWNGSGWPMFDLAERIVKVVVFAVIDAFLLEGDMTMPFSAKLF